jgi:hypothetical protein
MRGETLLWRSGRRGCFKSYVTSYVNDECGSDVRALSTAYMQAASMLKGFDIAYVHATIML